MLNSGTWYRDVLETSTILSLKEESLSVLDEDTVYHEENYKIVLQRRVTNVHKAASLIDKVPSK